MKADYVRGTVLCNLCCILGMCFGMFAKLFAFERSLEVSDQNSPLYICMLSVCALKVR